MHFTMPLPASMAPPQQATTEPRWVRRLLLGAALAFLTLFLGLPLAVVFAQAFAAGVEAYFAAVTEPFARSAIRLTLLAAGAAVGPHPGFGGAAAGAVAQFPVPGQRLLVPPRR